MTEHLDKPIGWINYLNLHPLKCELEKKISSHDFRFGVPREINLLIRNGEACLGPASSISLLKHESMEQALPLGITARGAIKSVYLGMNGPVCELVHELAPRFALIKEIFEHCFITHPYFGREFSNTFWKEIEDLPASSFDWTKRHLKIKFSEQSETSVILSKIFLRSVLFSKVKNREELNQFVNTSSTTDGGTIELLIGNDALKKKSSFKHILDLGSFWSFVSGLPFVFAVWQKSKGSKIPVSLAEKILKSGLDAQFKMSSSPQLYINEALLQSHEIAENQLVDYWKLIDYVLEPKDMESLNAFFSLGSVFLEKYDLNYCGKLAKWREKIVASPSIGL